MIGTKYLGELLDEGKFELFKHKRELLIAPIGSGKTHMIVSKAHLFDNILYVCDTNALKEQVKNDLKEANVTNVHIKTYAALHQITIDDYEYSYMKSFDLIVCDEIHNLVRYCEYSQELKYVRRLLFNDNEFDYNGKILMMTATPQYIEKLQQRIPGINTYYTINLMDNPEIHRLTTFEFDTIKHYSQIEHVLRMIRDNKEFEYGTKVLIYTSQVKTMLKIQEIMFNLELDSTVIHSMNHDREMSKETLERRKKILEEGIFEGDVLIINSSMETGINLKACNNFKYVIVNSSNIVEITQSRGRVRDDIKCLYTRIDDDRPFSFIDNYIGVELIKEDFMGLFKDLKDDHNNSWGIRKIKSELNKNGYEIEQYRRSVKGKKYQFYTIKLKNN